MEMVFNENFLRTVTVFVIIGFIPTALTIFLMYVVWSKIWLKQRFVRLLATGVTRQEARKQIKEQSPMPKELKVLLWLKYARVDEYYLNAYLKSYTQKHFGTQPERYS